MQIDAKIGLEIAKLQLPNPESNERLCHTINQAIEEIK